MWSSPHAALVLLAFGPSRALGCSRAFFNAEGYPAVSARTMDWMYPFNDSLLINPRGSKMDGGMGPAGRSREWTVKYGSVVSSMNTWLSTTKSSFTGRHFDYVRDGGTAGINEAGLGAHLLYLEATEYGPLGTGRELVSYARAVRYLLDTCATVRQAVAAMEAVQLAGPLIETRPGEPPMSLGTHLAVEDAAGDSAVLEVVAGELRVYHGRNYTVMTNDPPMPEQIANLRRYQPFTRMTVPPGDIASTSRFVRLAYFLNYLPKTMDSTVMAAEMRGVIATAASPLGAPATDDPELGVYPTWWISLTDYAQRVFYWGWTMNPNFIWVDVKALRKSGKLEAGSPTLHLDPLKPSLVGEVSKLFAPVDDLGGARLTGQPGSYSEAAAAALVGCFALTAALACAVARGLRAKLQEAGVAGVSSAGLLA